VVLGQAEHLLADRNVPQPGKANDSGSGPTHDAKLLPFQAIKILEHQTPSASDDKNQKIRFWFATGGAGFCVSRALAIKIMPLASNGRLVTIGDRIRFPDDVTLGFIVEYLSKVPLVVVDSFHSHLERMDHIEDFHNQVRTLTNWQSKAINIENSLFRYFSDLIQLRCHKRRLECCTNQWIRHDQRSVSILLSSLCPLPVL
jgi:Fringe-like